MAKTIIIPVAPIFLLLLLIGCIQNDDTICNTPYIRIADNCCLDRDGNNICDKDETTLTTIITTSTTTSTTPTTTTTKATTTTTKATTTSTYPTTTTQSTTSTSTTTTTLQKLPVTNTAFKAHIMSSAEYMNFLLNSGEKKMEMFVDTDSYAHAKDLIEGLDDKYNLDCFHCFNFSRELLWVSEFGNKDYAGYSCILDMETGTGAMYTFTSKKTTCRCDTIQDPNKKENNEGNDALNELLDNYFSSH